MSVTAQDIVEVIREMELPGVEVDSLSPTENLLKQGMDSLDMMDLYFRLEEKFGKPIKFDDAQTQHAQWTCIVDIAEGINKL